MRRLPPRLAIEYSTQFQQLQHNQLHQNNTGQRDDPDIVERNAWLIRHPNMPRVLKWHPRADTGAGKE